MSEGHPADSPERLKVCRETGTKGASSLTWVGDPGGLVSRVQADSLESGITRELAPRAQAASPGLGT